MYSNAENKMQVASIHIFGIKYGKNIIQKAFKSLDIVKAAGINESYSTELQKALNIYRCLEQNSYGIYISDENAIKEEKEVLGERKTGAENILLYGVPGSGKSHEIKTKYCNDEKMMERVVFHPDYTYSDFVGQILPRVEKDKDGNEKLKYVFTPGPFTRMLKKAQEDPSNHYYLVIEELNRGNAPAIFGEIFQLLDRKDEDEFPAEEVGESEYGISNYDVAKEVYGDENHPVRIPSNMNILATMNTADQNVFTLDTAFLRRWSTRQIENNFEKSEHSKDMIDGTKVSWGTFATVINDMIIDSNTDMVSSADKCLGIYFAKKKELDADKFSEKVLKHLWDNAFRMDPTVIFNESCNDKNRILFRHMLAIIDFEGDRNSDKTYRYGTYRFEYVWEKMIDKVFGIENKADYFPKTSWWIDKTKHENASLEPDTIMISGTNVYILDAKYYKYGVTGNTRDLPESTSINKQITYGEYVATEKKFKKKHGDNMRVYNAFLMPFDSLKRKCPDNSQMLKIGEAISNWKDNSEEYQKIQGILIDVKSLMSINVRQEMNEIEKLAKLIES